MSECKRCEGTGWWKYDHNHSQVCPACCTHHEGWWELTENYGGYAEGKDNRCCKAGCGTMARDLKDARDNSPEKDT